MEKTDRLMAFAAKEEILRNIVKTHTTILIEGWTGTGKTVTAIRAVKGMGDIYYYAESGRDGLPADVRHNDRLIIVEKAGVLRNLPSGRQCVIFDNLNQLGAEARGNLEIMIRERVKDRKIIVITRVVLDAQEFLEGMDAVVRFKQNTAQMLHSKLSDRDGLKEYYAGDGE